MTEQVEFTLRPRTRGFHLITEEIVRHLPHPLPEKGLLNLFVKHTSCALSINENADPDVRRDMESIYNHLVREREPYYCHTFEGDDDMPAHAKSSLTGVSITIPVYGHNFAVPLLVCYMLGCRSTYLLHEGNLLV